MANTYSQIYFHLVFSTKNRTAWIKPEIENRVWAYIGGIARKHKITPIQIGGTDDHIHGLVGSPATYSPSQIAKYLKGDSSKWIHTEFPELRSFRLARRLRRFFRFEVGNRSGQEVYSESKETPRKAHF